MKRMVFGGGLGNPKAEGRNPMGVGGSAGAPYLLSPLFGGHWDERLNYV